MRSSTRRPAPTTSGSRTCGAQRMSIYVRIPPNRLGERPAAAQPVLLAAGQPEHAAAARSRIPSLNLQCLLVHDEFTAMGRVGVIASAAAFLAGYNLRLLTVVQAMSQLDAVYGDKEARTFATNHGLQILFAPREQRDADEYSAMLGHFTERATSRGRSRSFGPARPQHGQPQRQRPAPRSAAAAGVQGARRRAPGRRSSRTASRSWPRRSAITATRCSLARLRPPPAVPRDGHGPALGQGAAALARRRRRARQRRAARSRAAWPRLQRPAGC